MSHVNTHIDVHAEFVKGIVTYEHTGHRPYDPFFNHLQKRFDRHPSSFTAHHPAFAGFLTPAHRIGQLPDGHYWDRLKSRYESHPHRFSLNHCPYIVEAIRVDQALPKPTCGTVPEPTTMISFAIGFILLWMVRSKK